MSNTKVANSRTHGEPDSIATLSSLMKDPPVTKEQHSQRMAKRGEVRRRLEDLMLEKASQDLW